MIPKPITTTGTNRDPKPIADDEPDVIDHQGSHRPHNRNASRFTSRRPLDELAED
jgi:hypothetical protein